MLTKKGASVYKRFRAEAAFIVAYSLCFPCTYTQKPENKHVRPTKDYFTCEGR